MSSTAPLLVSFPPCPTPPGLCPPHSPFPLPLSSPLHSPKVKGAIEGDQLPVVSEQGCPLPAEAPLSQVPSLQLRIQLLQGLRDITREEGCIGDDVTVHNGSGRGCGCGHISGRGV